MSRHCAFISGSLGLIVCTMTAIAQDRAIPDEFNFNSLNCSGSLKDELLTCSDVRIWNDRVDIKATTAQSRKLDFEQNEWRLVGNVNVAIDSANLTADSAVFVFAASELIGFELLGSPAALTDFIEERGTSLSGSADRIAYDQSTDTVLMTGTETGRVSFRVNDDEIATDNIAYNLGEQSFVSGEMEARLAPVDSESGLDPRAGP